VNVNSTRDALVLRGTQVRLDPLTSADGPALLAAATEDRSHYAFTNVPGNSEEMEAYLTVALQQQARGEAFPFVVRQASGDAVVGTTRFLDFGYWRTASQVASTPSVVEIGSTWLAASAQRTAVNTEAKLLMLSHAFEVWGCYRVSFQTDARNARSREAIARTGAAFEGVRRAHKLAADGSVRDTAFFSLVAAEWPRAKQRLRHRLAAA
jgi:RimJ/RimL family protein N-acetyltransferase